MQALVSSFLSSSLAVRLWLCLTLSGKSVPSFFGHFCLFPGGVCISPKRWNSEYLCIDHYQPLRFGCYKGQCFLQCERAQKVYCMSQQQDNGAWSKKTCTKHQDCASLNLICRNKCSAPQLQNFLKFYNSNQSPVNKLTTTTTTTILTIPSGYIRTDANTGE